MGFTKLFSSIVTSSIWCQDDATLRVWIAMLATCDAQGKVEGSIPGFASLARVTIEQMRTAIDILAGPDADSRTKDHDGRRIKDCDGGWLILNYLKYREKGQDKDGSRAAYFRARRNCSTLHSAVACHIEAEAEVPPNPLAGGTDVARNNRRITGGRAAARKLEALKTELGKLELGMNSFQGHLEGTAEQNQRRAELKAEIKRLEKP